MNPFHLLWIIPGVLALIIGAWWWGGRRPSSLAAPRHDPEKVEREHERIKAEADSNIEKINETADDWEGRLNK